jgi:hypothetical protein
MTVSFSFFLYSFSKMLFLELSEQQNATRIIPEPTPGLYQQELISSMESMNLANPPPNSQFVNSDDELLNQQREYEIKNKPMPVNNDDNLSVGSANSSVYRHYRNPNQNVTKKVFGKEFSISGPSVHAIAQIQDQMQHKIVAKKYKSAGPGSVNSFAFRPRGAFNTDAGTTNNNNNENATLATSVFDKDDSSLLTNDDDNNSITSVGPTTDLIQPFVSDT